MQLTLSAHHVHNQHPRALDAVENPARRLAQLTVAGTSELRNLWTAVRMPPQLLNAMQGSLHECTGSDRILDGYVIGDGVQIG